MDDKEIIKELTEKNAKLEEELTSVKERLKKYTNPERNKRYQQENKEMLKQRNYPRSKVSAEKQREYNKRAYAKRKKKAVGEEL